MNPVEVIARTVMAEWGFGPESVPDAGRVQAMQTAQAILFDLAKSGVRLIEPGDVLEETADVDGGTVSVLLRAG